MQQRCKKNNLVVNDHFLKDLKISGESPLVFSNA